MRIESKRRRQFTHPFHDRAIPGNLCGTKPRLSTLHLFNKVVLVSAENLFSNIFSRYIHKNLGMFKNRNDFGGLDKRLTSAAETIAKKTSFIIAMSMVDELLTQASLPSGVIKLCSGEVEGLVSRYPLGPSTNQSRRNLTHPSNKGYALFFRKS